MASQFNSLSEFISNGLDTPICAVCQDYYEDQKALKPSQGSTDSQMIKIETCGHQFHRGCLLRWLDGENRNTCPTCRAKLYHTNEDDAKEVEDAADELFQALGKMYDVASRWLELGPEAPTLSPEVMRMIEIAELDWDNTTTEITQIRREGDQGVTPTAEPTSGGAAESDEESDQESEEELDFEEVESELGWLPLGAPNTETGARDDLPQRHISSEDGVHRGAEVHEYEPVNEIVTPVFRNAYESFVNDVSAFARYVTNAKEVVDPGSSNFRDVTQQFMGLAEKFATECGSQAEFVRRQHRPAEGL